MLWIVTSLAFVAFAIGGGISNYSAQNIIGQADEPDRRAVRSDIRFLRLANLEAQFGPTVRKDFLRYRASFFVTAASFVVLCFTLPNVLPRIFGR